MNTTIQTKYGTATIGNHGYYVITSKKEGNYNKLLHRLIFEDFYKIKLPETIIIHHDDENKLNNEIWNLIPVTKSEHAQIHKQDTIPQQVRDKILKTLKGHEVSEETRKRISLTKTGSNYSEQGCENMSKSRNTTGFYCVSTKPASTRQGFSWLYQYYENGKHKSITSINLLKLKEKVISKKLKWLMINKKGAIETCKKYGYNLNELI